MKLILDLGSGNTCKNDIAIVREMIDTIHDIDTGKHEIILKWQLFESAPPNIPLERDVFDYAYDYACGRFKTTASVFDKTGLDFLLEYDVPFVKIACRPELYHLSLNSTANFYVSTLYAEPDLPQRITPMCCISRYPAMVTEYEAHYHKSDLGRAISDHTIGWDLYNKYKPQIIEKHFVHTRDSGNPDAGAFAVTVKELEEIL